MTGMNSGRSVVMSLDSSEDVREVPEPARALVGDRGSAVVVNLRMDGAADVEGRLALAGGVAVAEPRALCGAQLQDVGAPRLRQLRLDLPVGRVHRAVGLDEEAARA